jgi:hypothetical protein
MSVKHKSEVTSGKTTLYNAITTPSTFGVRVLFGALGPGLRTSRPGNCHGNKSHIRQIPQMIHLAEGAALVLPRKL